MLAPTDSTTIGQSLADSPFRVRFPVPMEIGQARRLGAMVVFCDDMDYQVIRSTEPNGSEAIWWCFGTDAEADAFWREFGGHRV